MNVTTQQARLRFTTIPSRLQDVMFSEQTDEIMDGIAQQYHLDEIKSGMIGKIAGWVMLGFIHPEDVSREIQQALGLSLQIAGEISKSLDAKLFSALRDDLSKAYAPAASSEEISGPKILQEVIKPQPVMKASVVMPAVNPAPAPRPPAAPKIISESFSATAMGAPKLAASGMPPKTPTPTANVPPQPKPQQVFSQTAQGGSGSGGISIGTSSALNKNTAGTAPQPAKSTMDKGWSKQTTQDPVVKLGIITPSMPTPTANKTTPGSSSPSPAPGAFSPKGMSEFDRLDMMKKSSGPTGTGTAAIPPPVMLHEVAPGASQNSSDFRITAGMQNQINKTTTPPPMPVRSAVIEFNNSGVSPKPSAPGYAGEFKTPATPPPAITSTGPRNITEISASPATPAPAQPPLPRPAPPPMPAAKQPSQFRPQGNKVIVKDFLGPEK